MERVWKRGKVHAISAQEITQKKTQEVDVQGKQKKGGVTDLGYMRTQ